MKAIDAMRTHISNLRYQGLTQVAMVDVEKCLDAIESELEERYVELPVDGDGVPIHIGDQVTQVSDRPTPVLGITYHKSTTPSICIERGDLWIDTDTLHHYKPPTVEDVLREFALKCEDAGNAGPEVERIASEFAERLQLREEGE